MLISREERNRRQRQRAKKSRSQLLGPVAQGGQGRAPMQRGYTKSSEMIGPPQFQKPYDAGADITQAGLAFKGGKGVRDWAKGGFKMPSGEGISDTISQYGTDIANRFGETGEALGNLFDTGGSGLNQGGSIRPMTAESLGQLQTGATPNINVRMPNQLTNLDAIPHGLQQESLAQTGGQNLFDAGTRIPTSHGSNLSFGGGAFPGSEYSSLLGAGGLPSQAGNIYAPIGTFGTTGGATIGQGGGSLGGTSALGGEAAAGGAGGGHPWMAYANIGKDLIMGGPGSEKITGNTYGDAVLRGAAAYYTMGLSEIPYMFL